MGATRALLLEALCLGNPWTTKKKNMASVLTHLGENIPDKQEAANVMEHYQRVLARIRTKSGATKEET